MIITTKLNCKQKTIHQKHHQAHKRQNALAELLPRNPDKRERAQSHNKYLSHNIYVVIRSIRKRGQ